MINIIRNIFRYGYINYIVILITLLFTNQKIIGQISASEIKAGLILRICENVTWSKPINDKITIACLSTDQSVYRLLKPTESQLKIQNKKIEIVQITKTIEFKKYHAIYYNSENYDNSFDILAGARDNNVLVITDNYNDPLFAMINLYNKDEKIAFKVNIPNLTLAGFSIKPSLLLNGGSVVDIKQAYEKFESNLKENTSKLNETKLELSKTENFLKQRDKIIKDRELEIERFTNEIKQYQAESAKLIAQVEYEKTLIDQNSTILSQKSNELLKKDEQLRLIYKDIEKKQTELNFLKNNVSELKNESGVLKNTISSKDEVLNQRELFISNQRKLIIVYVGFIIVLIVAALALTRLFFLKKKHNEELELKVNERTLELYHQKQQYLNLFNLAPVAILEIDFSKSKSYLDSLNITDEESYDRIINANPQYLVECLLKMDYLNVNKALLVMYEINDISLIKKHYSKPFDPIVIESLKNDFKIIFYSNKVNSYNSIRYNSKKEKLDIMIQWLDVSPNHEKFSRVLVTMTDITNLRKIESELLKHQRDLELLVKERTDEIGSLNEELISQNSNLNETNLVLEKVVNELEIANKELKEQKITLHNTLSELQQTQLQMLQSEKMASIGILTAGVAHEINNPLNFISSSIYALDELMKEVQIPDDVKSDYKLLLGSMNEGVQRATAIVKSLNTFNRKDQNIFQLCNIHNVIDNALLLLNHEIKNKHQVVKLYTNKPYNLIANSESLHQVFMNIFSNAVYSMKQEGTLTIETQLEKKFISIIITDTGEGMSDNVLKNIFDPFFTTKESGKGVGLGLAIVYKIIKEHKGEIKYSSKINFGTKVFINLPLVIQ